MSNPLVNTVTMDNMGDKNRLKFWHILSISFFISFIILLFCSANSFLYAFNDNQDINWYISMGNGMLDGKVPYKDLFEQKGPIVYFVFTILCLFPNVYYAAFFLEVICSTIFLFYVYKTAKLYTGDKVAILTMAITATIAFTSYFFVQGGGAVEEYCLPIYMYMIYTLLEFCRDNKKFTRLRAIIWGVLVGCLLFIKFTLLLLPFIIFVSIFITLIIEKQVKQAFKLSGFITIGIASVLLPVLLYFIINNAVKDFFIVYFYDNLFLYDGGSQNGGFVNVLVNLIQSLYRNLIVSRNFIALIFIYLGIFLERKKYSSNRKNLYLISSITFMIGLAITGQFSYYFLPIATFVPMGVCLFLDSVFKKVPNLCKISVVVSVCALLFATSIVTSNSIVEINYKKSDYIQFQVAEDIKTINSENPTLFCYKLWDYGFYNALGISPSVKYYANNLFSEEALPEMYEQYNQYIINKKTQFVIVESSVYEKEMDLFEDNYTKVNEYQYKYHKDDVRSFTLKVVLLVAN